MIKVNRPYWKKRTQLSFKLPDSAGIRVYGIQEWTIAFIYMHILIE